MKKTAKFLFLKLPFYFFIFGVALFLIFIFTDFKDFDYKINVFSNKPNFISPRGRKIDIGGVARSGAVSFIHIVYELEADSWQLFT